MSETAVAASTHADRTSSTDWLAIDRRIGAGFARPG